MRCAVTRWRGGRIAWPIAPGLGPGSEGIRRFKFDPPHHLSACEPAPSWLKVNRTSPRTTKTSRKLRSASGSRSATARRSAATAATATAGGAGRAATERSRRRDAARGTARGGCAAAGPRRVRRGATAPARGCGSDDALLRSRFQAILRYEDRGRPHPPARRDTVPLALRMPGGCWQRYAATRCAAPVRGGRAPAAHRRDSRRPVPPAACAAVGEPGRENASTSWRSGGRV